MRPQESTDEKQLWLTHCNGGRIFLVEYKPNESHLTIRHVYDGSWDRKGGVSLTAPRGESEFFRTIDDAPVAWTGHVDTAPLPSTYSRDEPDEDYSPLNWEGYCVVVQPKSSSKEILFATGSDVFTTVLDEDDELIDPCFSESNNSDVWLGVLKTKKYVYLLPHGMYYEDLRRIELAKADEMCKKHKSPYDDLPGSCPDDFKKVDFKVLAHNEL